MAQGGGRHTSYSGVCRLGETQLKATVVTEGSAELSGNRRKSVGIRLWHALTLRRDRGLPSCAWLCPPLRESQRCSADREKRRRGKLPFDQSLSPGFLYSHTTTPMCVC